MLLIIGVIIGFVMGLTGAGGALVAIPLFMQFLDMTLKEASIYSLLAVIIASLSNFYYQRKNASLSLAFTFVVFSALGSFLSWPYKNLLPDFGIAMMLALIALYSLWSVWVPRKKTEEENQGQVKGIKTITIGLTLGVLTTFTGLGGGVLMLPILLSMYRLPQNIAVATSLVVVGLSSLASFVIQVSKGGGAQFETSFFALILGIVITSYLLKLLMARISTKTSDNLRKVVFTIVVALSLAKIF